MSRDRHYVTNEVTLWIVGPAGDEDYRVKVLRTLAKLWGVSMAIVWRPRARTEGSHA